MRPAHADWYIDDLAYPDTLEGVTVTFKSYITPPPDSLTLTWWQVNMRVTGTQSAPYANTYAYSTHINFENETHKNGGNPWYFYAKRAA